MPQQLAPGLFVLALSGFLLLAGSAFLARGVRLSRRGVRVEGVVVGQHGQDGDIPVVAFALPDGTEHRGKLRVGPGPAVGEPMALVYDPANPDRVSGASFAQLWGVPLACGLLGGVGCLVAAAILAGVIPVE